MPKNICKINFVAQFHLWFRFNFIFFLGMVIYDNEFGTKENKIKPRTI